jgi:DNA polymerase
VSRVVDAAVATIAEHARSAHGIEALESAVCACTACPDLTASRQRVVPGVFPPHARLLLVGEAPGAQEDEAGRPFVGRGGQLLDRLLAAAGIDRSGVAVANVLKCRPPGNRTPTTAEARRCRGWLDRQVELVDPSLVVTLGGTALTWALGRGHRLSDLRGRVHQWNGRRLLPTYHPSAALRFGPNGAPMAALQADLMLAASAL